MDLTSSINDIKSKYASALNKGNNVCAMCEVASSKTKLATGKNSPTKKSKDDTIKSYNIDKEYSLVYPEEDKRTSLTVNPKTKLTASTIQLYTDRIFQVLGSKTMILDNNESINGLLFNSLGSSSGLIFPYTPTISCSTSDNYDTETQIMHSNYQYSFFKNSTPPQYTIDSVFTADNKANALHMLSAIWFLTACTKCEFGYRSYSDGIGGMPPPILYLNSYDKLINNIPVVINDVSYSYPDDCHYVNLLVDLKKSTNNIYLDNSFGVSNNSPTQNTKISDTTKLNVNDKYILSFWLPTKLSIKIGLSTQSNVLHTRYKNNLDDIKTGAYFLRYNVQYPTNIEYAEIDINNAIALDVYKEINGGNVSLSPTVENVEKFNKFKEYLENTGTVMDNQQIEYQEKLNKANEAIEKSSVVYKWQHPEEFKDTSTIGKLLDPSTIADEYYAEHPKDTPYKSSVFKSNAKEIKNNILNNIK